jgi:hypothetical protein
MEIKERLASILLLRFFNRVHELVINNARLCQVKSFGCTGRYLDISVAIWQFQAITKK